MDNVRTPSAQPMNSTSSGNPDSDLSSSIEGLQIPGSDMIVDGYTHYNQQENEVVNISPDAEENGEEQEQEQEQEHEHEHEQEQDETRVRADDCM